MGVEGGGGREEGGGGGGFEGAGEVLGEGEGGEGGDGGCAADLEVMRCVSERVL